VVSKTSLPNKSMNESREVIRKNGEQENGELVIIQTRITLEKNVKAYFILMNRVLRLEKLPPMRNVN
jgi:hypothetical protein